MDDQIIKLAEETLGRYNALTEELSDPNIFSDQRRYREVAKEHARLRRGAELCQNLLDSVNEMREARELVPGAESARAATRRPSSLASCTTCTPATPTALASSTAPSPRAPPRSAGTGRLRSR